MKLAVIDKNDGISLSHQCRLLSVPRNRLYYSPHISERNLELMHRIDELYTEDPTRGTRRLSGVLFRRFKLKADRGKVRRLMRRMGISAIYPKKRASPFLISSTKCILIFYEMCRLPVSIKCGLLISPTSG